MGATQLPLSQSKDLLSAWVKRTIIGRYQQSVLGWLWAIVQPVASVIVFSIIFTKFVPVDTGDIPYPVFSYIALIPWTFFSASLNDMTGSLVQNMSLVTKVYFPREVLPVSAMIARLLDLFLAAIVLVALMFFYRMPVNLPGLVFLPVILAVQIMFLLGIGLFTAAVNVFYRDVQPLLILVIQLWFYASPIIYPVSLVPEDYRAIYYLNPMAGILEAYRSVLLYQTMPGSSLITASIVALLMLILGYWVFKRLEFQFADVI